ncbi:MAG: polyphosphate kinase 2 family protein [Capnocytophaga sp.]|nr:polyphosphate kinase 2 family protein [Capnocytophaga sp.]
MDKINTQKYLVKKPVKLASVATYEDFKMSKNKLDAELLLVGEKIAEFQNMMYAHNKYNVLICIQGMDTSGKDSMIREIFKGFNSRGMVTYSFKTPTSKELSHDYLWRHYIALPERGKFGVFNRTHYENVLVTRVHPEYLLNENIPHINSVSDIPTNFWKERYEQIRNFEKHIAQNGTIIFKFFLHISKEEQRQRLLRRLEKPSKNWKFSAGDLAERKLWEQYQEYYEEAINETSTKLAPWHIIPADNKRASRLLVARVLWDTLKKYTDVKYPELDEKTKANLGAYKAQLEAEKP